MPLSLGPEVLTVAQHGEADRLAVAAGVSIEALMEAAGRAVADAILQRYTPRPVIVLCGPGNNGGDGFVAARLLREAGWSVRVAELGESAGVAAEMRAKWGAASETVSPQCLAGAELAVDALFGAGLSRPLEGAAEATVRAIAEQHLACVAVDVPSGLAGDTGVPLGLSARADLTVTFFRKKPAHLIYPGRKFCGEVVVADIGTPASVVGQLGVDTWENGPGLWSLPEPAAETHKYGRGHALVVSGGPLDTGAARLAAEGALRVGAGLVTIGGPPDSLPVLAAHVTEILLARLDSADDVARLLGERRRNVALIGPGNGVGARTADAVLAALRTGAKCVLDADALTSFADRRDQLLQALRPGTVITPHDGEFARLFPEAAKLGTRLARARAAAAESDAIVVLKGADTAVAHPSGRAVINTNAPPTSATAGSGDVLAGFIAGLRAQGMGAFEAAAAAVWLHGEAAQRVGPGLIASDLHRVVPRVLASVPRQATPAVAPLPPRIEVRDLAARHLMAVAGRAAKADLPKKIPPLFDQVYEVVRRESVPNLGVNVILYLSGPVPEFSMEAGVEVAAPFTGRGAIRGVETPAGPAVVASHWGAYAGLPAAHAALHAWCKRQGHAITGLNWEVYGHWSDDPADLKTEVCYQRK